MWSQQLTATAPASWAGWSLFTFLPDAKLQKSFSNLNNPRRMP
jgi:hypothetical protein